MNTNATNLPPVMVLRKNGHQGTWYFVYGVSQRPVTNVVITHSMSFGGDQTLLTISTVEQDGVYVDPATGDIYTTVGSFDGDELRDFMDWIANTLSYESWRSAVPVGIEDGVYGALESFHGLSKEDVDADVERMMRGAYQQLVADQYQKLWDEKGIVA